MTDKMREAFEKWAITKSLDLRKDKDGWGQDRYYHSHVDAMWFAWQAANASALPPGFVAVPVEPTPRMQAESWDGIEKASWFGMNYNEAARKIWADMLAARPDPQP